ncbi:hypothetical protein [Mycolicibacterium mageritense]|uniref:hypothetical protein n=1 Tax=Mycolicibacterium mageritense TaxID=53462 RepID=UPI0011DB8FF1|nr:hypothetical protein [Mycolicibacterium mageritense]TXI63307.1 MAG: hypothetical protein E6Q55_09745 [Mycolicibacterium mageritense]
MTPKKKIVTEVVDLDPVDLDPPDPAIARWEEFAARDIDIEHDGDAEKVIPFPRPAWADPSRDDVCATSQESSYRSPKVLVASLTAGGCDDGGWLEPASAGVSARVHGNGNRLVGLTIRRYVNEEWREFGMSMPPSAAVELADVLRAAVDLFGSGQ